MALSISAPKSLQLKPRIVVFGVGGAGGNAVNNMIESDLQGVDFVVANTDAQALHFSKAECVIQLGTAITGGLGAGAVPEKGAKAALDSMDEITAQLEGAHMVFITAGMGGGTGTGAAPVIAQAARDMGILTVAVVTKPFHFESPYRMRLADAGIKELKTKVDTLIVIPNENLYRIANEKTTVAEAFGMADEVLHSGVRGLTSLMVQPGTINLDFADVRTVMDRMGNALMGTGEASGEGRAEQAARMAIANPLLDDVCIRGARAVLINICGGQDMTLIEMGEAVNLVSAEVSEDANVVVGSTLDDSLDGLVRVSVVATGIDWDEEENTQDAVQKTEEPVLEPAPDAPQVEMSAVPVQEAQTPPYMVATDAPVFSDYAPQPTAGEEHHARKTFTAEDHGDDADDELPFIADPNNGPAPEKSMGLFGRVFFGSRRKPAGAPPAMIAPEQPKMEHRARPSRFSEPQNEADPDPVDEMEETDLLSGHKDDQLEIPAFLRRQAN